MKSLSGNNNTWCALEADAIKLLTEIVFTAVYVNVAMFAEHAVSLHWRNMFSLEQLDIRCTSV